MAIESFGTSHQCIYTRYTVILYYYKSHYNVTYSTEEKHKVDEWWVEGVQVLISQCLNRNLWILADSATSAMNKKQFIIFAFDSQFAW